MAHPGYALTPGERGPCIGPIRIKQWLRLPVARSGTRCPRI